MNKTSDKAVADYLNNMFMDLTVSDSETVVSPPSDYQPLDSNDSGFRLVPCMDPFQFMNMGSSIHKSNIWLAYLLILNLSERLPQGSLKQYCLRQCQTLLNQFTQRNHH